VKCISFGEFIEEQKNSPPVLQSTSYNTSPTLKQQLNEHWHTFLDNNEKIKDALENTNPLIVYKKGQTLKTPKSAPNTNQHKPHSPIQTN